MLRPIKKKNQRLLNVPCVHHRRWTPCVCLKRDTDQGSGVNLEDPPPHNLCRLLIPTKPRLGIASILSGCPDMWSVNWPLVCSRHLHNTWLLFNCPVYFLFSPFFFGLFLYLAFKKNRFRHKYQAKPFVLTHVADIQGVVHTACVCVCDNMVSDAGYILWFKFK